MVRLPARRVIPCASRADPAWYLNLVANPDFAVQVARALGTAEFPQHAPARGPRCPTSGDFTRINCHPNLDTIPIFMIGTLS
jgi:hypothetical protein